VYLIVNLAKKVNDCIGKHQLLTRGDGILVGVSGGPDSVALFHILFGLKDEYGWRLAVAHLGHGVRGEEARRDALSVAQLAKEKGVPFFLKEVDLPQLKSVGDQTNLEALGRKERYQFFNSVAVEFGYNRVATGHTRDDQAETMLMWLIRGTGRRGLGGIPPKRRIFNDSEGGNVSMLVRPLIEVSRQEIMTYLKAESLEFREDSTNLDCRYLRNWIRHRLLLQLKERVDNRLTERLAHLADIWREEEKILDEVGGALLEKLVVGPDLLRGALLGQGAAMQRRVMRSWLEARTGSLLGVGFEDIERALSFVGQGPVQGRLYLPGGWQLCREYDYVRIEKTGGKGPDTVHYHYLLPHGGRVSIPEAGVELQSSGVSYEADSARPQSEMEAVFDSAVLPETLTVRNFRAGDRFQPLGMQGHKKVKDLFIEKKVPFPIRRTLPIVLAGDRILWIPSYGRSEFAKTGPRTCELLKVRLSSMDGPA
jgi:tRNA(Ile)-lysidine synthase